MPDIQISHGPLPGALERIVAMHAAYYSAHWEFGRYFEDKVTTGLTAFLEAYEPGRDGLWMATLGDRIEASIAIDGSHADTDGAHLRWFIASDVLRGRGVGSRLMRTAVDFCDVRGYDPVYLWTFAGLDAARALYDREGFRVVQEQPGDQWGTRVLEQRLERPLPEGSGRHQSPHPK